MMDIERIKAANDVADVLGEVTGFTFVGRGGTLKAREHDSLVVFLDTQTWKWFSQNTHGDVITAVEHFRNCDFRAAVEWLAERAGLPVDWGDTDPVAYVAKRKERDALTAVCEWLHDRLLETPEAMAFATARGWTAETIERERVGYWPGRTAVGTLHKYLDLHEVDKTLDVVRMWAEDWPERMLVYTHWLNGRVVYATGRSIESAEARTWTRPDGQEVTRPKSYNPKVARLGERQPYFNAQYNRGAAHVVLCEGQGDAISWGQWGVAAVASCGLSSAAWLEVVRMLAERHEFLYLNVDAETPGTSAWLGVVDGALKAGEVCPGLAVLEMGAHHDANDALMAGVTAREAEQMLADAPPLAVWYTAVATQASSPLVRREMERTAVAQVARLATTSERLYARHRAELAGVLAGGSVTALDKAVKAAAPAISTTTDEGEGAGGKRRGVLPTPPDDVLVRGLLVGQPADHEGHAQAVLGLFPGQLLFVPEWGWLAFNGRYWERQGAEALAVRRVTETLRLRQAVAVEREMDELAQASAANSYTVSGVMSQLKSLVTVGVDEFDAHPDHINCANGVVSLETGEVEPHAPHWRFMWCIEADYRPELASAPLWHKFVWESVYNGDAEDSKAVLFWLRDALGYSLTGHTSEELFLYLFGPSRSGKGTLTQTLLTLLGRPVSREVKMDMFYNSGRPDTQNFHLAPLVDARLVVASETSRHQRLDPALLKSLTGGDEIYASNKGKDHFNFKPRFQLMMSSNWPLNMDSDDDAAWESRVRVVPFPNSKVGKEDKGLKDRLLEPENLAGVLAWLVAGAMNWYRHGRKLKPQPESMVVARDLMRHEQDLVGIWLAEEFDVADPQAVTEFTPMDLLTKNYQDWCKANGLRAKGRSALDTTLQMKGYVKAKRRHPLFDNPRAGFDGLKLAGIGNDAKQKEIEL